MVQSGVGVACTLNLNWRELYFNESVAEIYVLLVTEEWITTLQRQMLK